MNISRKKQHLYTTFLILKWVIKKFLKLTTGNQEENLSNY